MKTVWFPIDENGIPHQNNPKTILGKHKYSLENFKPSKSNDNWKYTIFASVVTLLYLKFCKV